jgi:hypothetical protein
LNTVPVLLLAGATDPVDEQRLHDSGANGVLEKPFEPSHVISRVKELLGLKTTPPAAPTRLVTSPETRPARPPAAGRPAGAAPPIERPEASPPAPAPATVVPPAEPPVPAPAPTKPGSGIFRTVVAAAADSASAAGTAPSPAGQTAPPAPADDVPAAPGDARDWFAGYEPGPTADERALLAEELGVSGPRFHAPGDERRSTAPAELSSSAADVFESLLAAEQGNQAPVVLRAAVPELTPESLDHLAARIVERLPLDALRDELLRGVAHALTETVAREVRDSVATETRAAVAEAVQAAVDGTIPDTVRTAVGEAVAAAVPQAVLDAVRGEGGRQVNEIVHDTAERLVREEIARIRARQ